jgi:hypothetical protein
MTQPDDFFAAQEAKQIADSSFFRMEYGLDVPEMTIEEAMAIPHTRRNKTHMGPVSPMAEGIQR